VFVCPAAPRAARTGPARGVGARRRAPVRHTRRPGALEIQRCAPGAVAPTRRRAAASRRRRDPPPR